jgi:hypothetical protein
MRWSAFSGTKYVAAKWHHEVAGKYNVERRKAGEIHDLALLQILHLASIQTPAPPSPKSIEFTQVTLV